MASYERFDAWRFSHALAIAVHRATREFPAAERYGLTSQMRRAAFAVPANIVEGASKRGAVEFRRFLDISLGSLNELGYWFRVSRDLELCDSGTLDTLERMHGRALGTLWGLYRAVSAKSSGRSA